jgi:hypothetical protein
MSERKRRSPVVQFLAWLLMGAGALIFTTAGACSLLFSIIFIPTGNNYYFGDLGSMIVLVLTMGGVPFLIGLALFFGGRRLARPPKTPPPTMTVTEHDDEPTTGA